MNRYGGLPGEAVLGGVSGMRVVIETLRGGLAARAGLSMIIRSETSRWYSTE
jgi:hypothetical protein